jgi:hypothetical protein
MNPSDEVVASIAHCAQLLHDAPALKTEVHRLRLSSEPHARLAVALFDLELARLGDEQARRHLPNTSDDLLVFWRAEESSELASIHPRLSQLWSNAAEMLKNFDKLRFRGALAACFESRANATDLMDAIELLEPAGNPRVEFARCLYHLELVRLQVDSSRSQFAQRAGVLLEAFKDPSIADSHIGDDKGLRLLWHEVYPYLDEFIEGLEEQAEARAKQKPESKTQSVPVEEPKTMAQEPSAVFEEEVTPLERGTGPTALAPPMPPPLPKRAPDTRVTQPQPIPVLSPSTNENASLEAGNWADALPESIVETLPPGLVFPTEDDDGLPPEPSDVEWIEPEQTPARGSSAVAMKSVDDATLPPSLAPPFQPEDDDVEVLDDAELEEPITPEVAAFWKHTIDSLGMVPKNEGRQLGLLATDDRARRKRMNSYLDSIEPHAELPEARAFACLIRLSLAGHTKEKSLFGGKNPRRKEAMQAALSLLDSDATIAGRSAVWFELDGQPTVDAMQSGLTLLYEYLQFCAKEMRDPKSASSVERYFE